MDVYCDAVFFPKVYDRKEGFLQEGWNYKIADKDAPLEYNGIVYSEMKGRNSNPSSVIYDFVDTVLHPDTCYAYSSGGEPEAIPDLTYEDFLDFHKKYYAPENCYLYLYGDMDINVCLERLHDGYLSKFEKTGTVIEIAGQKPFEKPAFAEKAYAVVGEEGEEELNYLAAAYALDRDAPELDYAVLYYLLMGTEASPLKKGLKERGIGESISGYYSVHNVTPGYYIVIQNSKHKAEFLKEQIDGILAEVLEKGLDAEFIDSCLNFFEFHHREQDFGTTPKGIEFLTEQFACHVYGGDPFDNLFWTERINELRKKPASYFTEKIERFILKNNHAAFVTLVPDDKLNEKMDKAVEKRLAEFKKGLSDGEVDAIIKEGEALTAFQDTPDSEEALSAIPMVGISDLKKEAERIPLEGRDGNFITNVDTNGITYVNLWFDTRGLGVDKLKMLNMLMFMFGKLPTKNYSLEQLTNAVTGKTGGITFDFQEFDFEGGFKPFILVTVKALRKNLGEAFRIGAEILTNTLFDDKERVVKFLTEMKANNDNFFISAGHNTAIMRAMSRVSPKWMYREHVKGIDYFRYLEGLLKELERGGNVFEKLAGDFAALAAELFSRNRLVISATVDADMNAEFCNYAAGFKDMLADAPYTPGMFVLEPTAVNEAFITSSKVQYNVIANNFLDKGLKYCGNAEVAVKIISDSYLFDNIRAKGGAYGYGAAIRRGGELFMFSYRDPKLKETYKVYEETAEWLRKLQVNEREMTKYILGATNANDRPKTARQKGFAAVSNMFAGITYEQRQKERAEVLSAVVGDIRGFADMVGRCAADNVICTVGSESAVNGNRGMFGRVEKL
jgi:hypothetical protein